MGEQGSELPPRDFGRRPPRNRSVSTAEVSSSRLAAMNRGLSPVSSRPRRTSVVHDLERREVGAAFDRAAVCLNPIGIPQPLAGSLELLGDPQMIELDRARDSLRDRVQCRRVAFGTHRLMRSSSMPWRSSCRSRARHRNDHRGRPSRVRSIHEEFGIETSRIRVYETLRRRWLEPHCLERKNRDPPARSSGVCASRASAEPWSS
jgi:hypothetical protein